MLPACERPRLPAGRLISRAAPAMSEEILALYKKLESGFRIIFVARIAFSSIASSALIPMALALANATRTAEFTKLQEGLIGLAMPLP